MKLSEKAVLAACVLGLAALCVVENRKPASADTGYEGAVRTERGSYGQVFKITGSSIAGTAFFSNSVKRADGTAFNNTSSTVWIGTITTTQQNRIHDNIEEGFPVLSSGTFPLDGNFTGTLYFTCDVSVASCEMRTVEGRVQ